MTSRSNIFGLVRFSLVLKDHVLFPPIRDKSFRERRRDILSPERLTRRLDLFERLVLPAFRNQTDPDFVLGLMISDVFPEMFETRLAAMIADIPQVRILKVPAKWDFKTICRHARQALYDGAPVGASFRIDDDDVVSDRYIARLRGMVHPHNAGYPVSYREGLEIQMHQKLAYRPRARPRHSIGLAMVVDNDAPQEAATIYQMGAHRKVHENSPILIDATPDMYLRLLHGSNLSGERDTIHEPIPEDVFARMEASFSHITRGALEDFVTV